LGVLAFFVLSGFLITWLLLKEEERYGEISLKLFYIRRSLRIFPAFYCYWFLLNSALLLVGRQVVIPQAVCAAFYVNNYYQAIFGDPSTGLSHTWSLGIEEQFYVLWPMTFLFLKRNRSRMWFLVAAIAAVWVYREVLVFLVHMNQGYIYEAFDARADHLLIGCLLAVVLRDRAFGLLWERLCWSPWFPVLTAAGLFLSAALANRYGTMYRDAVGFIVDPLLVAILIVQTVAHRSTGLGVALNWGWMRYLGSISYSIYLYQQIVIGPAKSFTTSTHWLALPASMACVVIVASASYWIVEKPFLRLKGRFFVPVGPQS
jgi:peptidoglycan/LPS O-acetylase OafA/YrhL